MSLLEVPVHLRAEQTLADIFEVNKGLDAVFKKLSCDRKFPMFICLKLLDIHPHNLVFIANTMQDVGYKTQVLPESVISLAHPSLVPPPYEH